MRLPSALLQPRRIALIGASDSPDSIGAGLTRHCLDANAADIVLVNRRHSTVYGQPVLHDVAEVPQGLDLAVVMTPWSTVPGVIDTLDARGCAAAVVLSVAQEGGVWWDSRQVLLDRLRRRLRKRTIRLIGPASQGLLLPRLGLNLSLCARMPPPGPVAFVAASAAITDFYTGWAAQTGVGASMVLGLGDALDLEAGECLDALAEDPHTRAVLLYLDHMQDARRWLSAARALARRKPLVVLIDPQFAAQGGGSPAAPATLLRTALARVGALVVDDLQQLCAAANVDLPAWPQVGSRFAVLGNAPALGALASAAIQSSGGALATLTRHTERVLRPLLPRGALRQPLDLRRDADGTRYATALTALRADPGVDVVLALHHDNAFAAGMEVASALSPAADGTPPLLCCFVGGAASEVRADLARRGIAAFPTPESAVAAYALNRRYFQLRTSLQATPPPLLDSLRLSPSDLHALRENGLDPRHRAARLLQMLDLAVDPLPATATHAASGWALGLAADQRLGALAYVVAPDGDVRAELLPLDRSRVEALLGPPTATAGMGDFDADGRAQWRRMLLRLALARVQLPELRAFRLGCLRRTEDGHWQAQVTLEWQIDGQPSYAFAPVPLEPHEPVTLRDGTPLLLRPIQAEDEPRLSAGFTRLSPEEVRMRFLYPLKQLTHDLAARLTQLDDDREIALVLSGFEPPGQADLYGVVRAALDLRQRRAEFAIVIPRALGRQGLGQHLLVRLMERLAARGIQRIEGDVLVENVAMRALARRLGFRESIEDNEPGVLRVWRNLTP